MNSVPAHGVLVALLDIEEIRLALETCTGQLKAIQERLAEAIAKRQTIGLVTDVNGTQYSED